MGDKENFRKCFKCGRSPAQDSDIKLFRFPKPGKTNMYRCEMWAKYCFPDTDWLSTDFQKKLFSEHRMLCDRHFKATSFSDYPDSRKLLHRHAVPFDMTSEEGVEYLDTDQYLYHDLNHETKNNEEFQNNPEEHETVTPDTSVSTTNNLQTLKIKSVRSDHDSCPQIPSPASSKTTLPSPAPPPSKKQKQTDNVSNDEVRESCDSGRCDRDIDVLNTLNKFIEYEKEKDKLQHEREMTRIKQADKLLNVMDKIANVFVVLAPSIKKFLERDEVRGEDR